MTSKDLYAQLESAGWMFGSEIDKGTGVTWYAYRRLIDGADCACNDKPPSLLIKPYSLDFPGSNLRSVNFEIRGQLASGRWVEFAVYGVRYEDVLLQAPSCTEVLLKAWNAVAGM